MFRLENVWFHVLLEPSMFKTMTIPQGQRRFFPCLNGQNWAQWLDDEKN